MLVVSGKRRLPKFKVEVRFSSNYQMCGIVNMPYKETNIKVQCKSALRGRMVKITTQMAGRLSLCEVAVYGIYG